MLIDFSSMEEKILPAFKGGNKEYIAKMFSDDNGKIMFGKLVPGASIGLHTHDTSSEYIYILSGKADYYYDGEKEYAEAGQCHYCPMGHEHTMINNSDEDLLFFAVVAEK